MRDRALRSIFAVILIFMAGVLGFMSPTSAAGLISTTTKVEARPSLVVPGETFRLLIDVMGNDRSSPNGEYRIHSRGAASDWKPIVNGHDEIDFVAPNVEGMHFIEAEFRGDPTYGASWGYFEQFVGTPVAPEIDAAAFATELRQSIMISVDRLGPG